MINKTAKTRGYRYTCTCTSHEMTGCPAPTRSDTAMIMPIAGNAIVAGHELRRLLEPHRGSGSPARRGGANAFGLAGAAMSRGVVAAPSAIATARSIRTLSVDPVIEVYRRGRRRLFSQ